MATKVKLIADNVITTDQIDLTSINTDNLSEGSTNLYFTNARVDSHLSGGTGVTYSSGEISIGQAVATDSNVTFADLTVTGDLNITGDINSYNVTDLDVTDQTITLGAGQIEANSGGSGIIVAGSEASILWDENNDEWDFNKGINVDSDTFVVDNTNNRVGIGTGSPTNVKLQINESLSGTAGTGHLAFGEASTPLWNWRLNTTSADLILDRSYSGWQSTPVISFDRSSGNVGIGTGSPSAKLESVSNGAAYFNSEPIAAIFRDEGAGRATVRIRSDNDKPAELFFDVDSAIRWDISARQSDGGYALKFYPQDSTPSLSGVGPEVLILKQNGDNVLPTTGALTLNKGTTAQRPSSPTSGMFRYNTDNNTLEYYDNSNWITIEKVGVVASGSNDSVTDVTISGQDYRVHTWTSSGSLTITTGGEVEYLVIGGGGGASGRDVGGGGGAGGYRCNVPGESSGGGASAEAKLNLAAGTYTVTIGAGGAGGADGGSASPGSNSVFGSITAVGGGGGKSYNAAVTNDGAGGSGGGAAGIDSISSGTNLTGGVATSNQGYDGGDGLTSSYTDYGGGGGGGAGAEGADAGNGKDGGIGVQSSINGTATYRAGGGGGAGHRSTGSGQEGSGGTGGGGDATNTSTTDTVRNGTANTGGGAGASRQIGHYGGTGGSGIVIVRYKI